MGKSTIYLLLLNICLFIKSKLALAYTNALIFPHRVKKQQKKNNEEEQQNFKISKKETLPLF